MQESEKLVLGIDLCDDITQVTVMRPRAAEPDAVCFDARTRKEYLPTLLYENQTGERSIEEVIQSGVTVLPAFFRAAVNGEEVQVKEETLSARELLQSFLTLLFEKIQRRFEGQEIGFVTMTCEEANTEASVKDMLYEMLEHTLGFKGNCLVLSHMEAFLHFVIRQEENLWENGSAAFDYSMKKLLFYRMECRRADGRRLLLADYKDYSDVIPADIVATGDMGRIAPAFERLAEIALQQRTGSLFATGRAFDGEWAAEVLRLFSRGRRVFRGQNLYTQGACYAGAEKFREERNVDFAVLTPEQITVDVFLVAESPEQEEDILMAHVGDAFRDVKSQVEVLLNGTDRVTFKIVPAGETTPMVVKVAPKLQDLRGDYTNRYQVRIFFVKRNVMVIQLKETGFGTFYPPTYRIYEEVVDFSQFES